MFENWSWSHLDRTFFFLNIYKCLNRSTILPEKKIKMIEKLKIHFLYRLESKVLRPNTLEIYKMPHKYFVIRSKYF